MKRKVLLGLAGILVVGSLVTACGSEEAAANVITVGASVTPHAEILEQLVEPLSEAGYDLEIVEFSDYVLPNTALFDGELDANYFQHVPYLDTFNEENGTDLTSVFAVHFEPLALYAGKLNDLSNLEEGGTITVPNDTSNEARALLLLEELGLITLSGNAGLTATVQDIEENPLNLDIVEVEAAQLARSLPDVDFAVITGNYALEGGLTSDDVVEIESGDSLGGETYANIIAVKEGQEENEGVKALVEALQSNEIREFIETTYGGVVVPVF